MSQTMTRRFAEKNKVLLVNITRLGDMLQATPAIAGMKMENPDVHITVLVEKQFEQICHWLPNIDEVLTLDLGMTVRSLARGTEGVVDAYEYVSEFVEDLKTKDFDYCLNMSSSAYTALLLKLLDVKRHGGWTSDEEGYRVIESDWAKLFATSVFHQNRQFNSINLVDVFRCSADVEEHPNKLMITVGDEAKAYCRDLIDNAGFTNTGPLIAIQAGASQKKRQWLPVRFIELIDKLVNQHGARVVLTGTEKELSIIDPIKTGVGSENVFVAAGKTNIPQLAALLEMSDVLITGDTGPMHIAVATGTPVVTMFLASAFGFETGPYSVGNIVLQPVISCGPCNPNKACARPDCHDTINPSFLADLVMLRVKGDVEVLPADMQPENLMIYRSDFDEHNFCQLTPLNHSVDDPYVRYRDAYRKMWLDDIAGYQFEKTSSRRATGGALGILDPRASLDGLQDVIDCAKRGMNLIDRLSEYIRDASAPGHLLSEVSDELSELDREIEQKGYHFSHLGPVTRMFLFAKENISGTDPSSLASQMKGNYSALERRCEKLSSYFH